MSWREEFRIWSCRAACCQLARVGGFRGKGEKLQRERGIGFFVYLSGRSTLNKITNGQ